MMRLDELSGSFAAGRIAGRRSVFSRMRAAFSRGHAAMMAAQEAKAERLVAPYLARQDDESLQRLGYSAAEIALLRREAGR